MARYCTPIGQCSTVISCSIVLCEMLSPYQIRKPSRAMTPSRVASSTARVQRGRHRLDELGDAHMRAAPGRRGAAEEGRPEQHELAELGVPGDVGVERHAGRDIGEHHDEQQRGEQR